MLSYVGADGWQCRQQLLKTVRNLLLTDVAYRTQIVDESGVLAVTGCLAPRHSTCTKVRKWVGWNRGKGKRGEGRRGKEREGEVMEGEEREGTER